MEREFSRDSSEDSKRKSSEAVFELLGDYLFNNVNLLNNPSLVTSGATTSTTNYVTLLRVPDTSGGKYLRVDKKSRFRAQFYFSTNQSSVDGYVLSPCVYQSAVAPTNVSQLNAYVGIKVLAGNVSIVSKYNGVENIRATSLKILDANTRVIEIIYNVSSFDVFIDNVFLGKMDIDMSAFKYNQITMYPIIAPIRSTNGSSVQVVVENYQFLQDK